METTVNTVPQGRKRVYKYFKVIQQLYSAGYGWEDCEEYECKSDGFIDSPELRLGFRNCLDNYRLMGYSTRVIVRRVKI